MVQSNEEKVKREVDRLLQEAAVYEQQAHQQGLTFVSVSEEELAQLIQQTRPVDPGFPEIWGFAYRPLVQRGQDVSFQLQLYNPTSVYGYSICYASFFFGTGASFMPIEWALLSGRDPQWPIRTSENFFGLPPGISVWVSVPYIVPDNVPLGRPYFAQAVVWSLRNPTDMELGRVLARATFPAIEVVA
jgi:hypothetical protein